jgi:hypothetical protein
MLQASISSVSSNFFIRILQVFQTYVSSVSSVFYVVSVAS